MVLTGRVQRELVGHINTHGPLAVGMTGEDAHTMTAVRRPAWVDGRAVDIGLVGDVVDVNPRAVRTLLEQGHIPVVSPVARGEDAQVYNVNADLAASALAVALDAARLVVLTDVAGLYADWPHSTEVIEQLTADELAALLPGLAAGMLPKMEGCLRAYAAACTGRTCSTAVYRTHCCGVSWAGTAPAPWFCRSTTPTSRAPGRVPPEDPTPSQGSREDARVAARVQGGRPGRRREAHAGRGEPVPQEEAAAADRRGEQGTHRLGARPGHRGTQQPASQSAALPVPGHAEVVENARGTATPLRAGRVYAQGQAALQDAVGSLGHDEVGHVGAIERGRSSA